MNAKVVQRNVVQGNVVQGSMAASIREAILDDVEAILALEQGSATAAHWPVNQYAIRIAGGQVIAAEQGGRVCGFVCWRAAAGEWEIENVVVGADERQRGIGAALVRAVIEKWRASGGTAVLLEVRESNAAARRLYEKCGLRELGRRRGYYEDPPEDAVLMTLGRDD